MSVVIASVTLLLAAVVLVRVLSPGEWRRPAWWAAVVGGMLSFPVALGIQPTLQKGYLVYIGQAITAMGVPALIADGGLALISGIVQEAVKLLAVFIVFKVGATRLPGPLGAATGLGFGVIEAFSLVFLPLLGTGVHPVALVERVFATTFHAGVTFIAAAGLTGGLRGAAKGYVIAALLHGMLNYGVILKAHWVLGLLGTEIWVAVGSLLTLGWAWRLRAR